MTRSISGRGAWNAANAKLAKKQYDLFFYGFLFCDKCGGRFYPMAYARIDLCPACIITEAAERIGARAELVTSGAQLCADGETDEQYRANRKQQTQEFLARMNSPEMVARRGTVLTPHGWRVSTPKRKPETKPESTFENVPPEDFYWQPD